MPETKEITLREVTDELRAWSDTIDGMEEDDPQRETAIFEQTKAIMAGRDKVEGFAKFLLRLDQEVDFAKSEAARMSGRAKRLSALHERLSGYAVEALHGAELRKVEGHTLVLGLHKGPDVVVIEDEAAVPSKFKRLTIQVPARDWEDLMEWIRVRQGPEDAVGSVDSFVTLKACDIDKLALKKAMKEGLVPGVYLQLGRDTLQVKS